MTGPFAPRETVEQVEEGHVLAPKFDANGLIPLSPLILPAVNC